MNIQCDLNKLTIAYFHHIEHDLWLSSSDGCLIGLTSLCSFNDNNFEFHANCTTTLALVLTVLQLTRPLFELESGQHNGSDLFSRFKLDE